MQNYTLAYLYDDLSHKLCRDCGACDKAIVVNRDSKSCTYADKDCISSRPDKII